MLWIGSKGMNVSHILDPNPEWDIMARVYIAGSDMPGSPAQGVRCHQGHYESR